MWVQLLAIQHIDTDGVSRVRHPGDWVEVGKQTALAWIADGAARTAVPTAISLGADVGIVLREDVPHARALLARLGLQVPVAVGPAATTYPRTLVWDPALALRPELLVPGFAFLDRWDVAVPLWSYTALAADLGTEADRALTAAVVHELRVPVYDPRLLFLRRGEATDALLETWQVEHERPGAEDDRLAFLRALYRTRPLVLAVPTSWRGAH